MTKIYRYWDVMLGGHALRVSAFNGHGHELYAVISDEGSRLDRKERKRLAKESVELAVKMGREPGAVPPDLAERGRDYVGQDDLVLAEDA